MEATEIEEFRKQVEEGGESGLGYVSLAISILAVFVAMVTVLGHRSHTDAVLQQARASDQWNEYQAQKIRQTDYAIAVDTLNLRADANSPGVEKKLGEYKARIDKSNGALPEEKTKALEFEADVTRAEHAAGRYDLGEALLAIAVVLSSITLLTRRQAFFIAGVVIGLTGALIAASVLLLH